MSRLLLSSAHTINCKVHFSCIALIDLFIMKRTPVLSQQNRKRNFDNSLRRTLCNIIIFRNDDGTIIINFVFHSSTPLHLPYFDESRFGWRNVNQGRVEVVLVIIIKHRVISILFSDHPFLMSIDRYKMWRDDVLKLLSLATISLFQTLLTAKELNVGKWIFQTQTEFSYH